MKVSLLKNIFLQRALFATLFEPRTPDKQLKSRNLFLNFEYWLWIDGDLVVCHSCRQAVWGMYVKCKIYIRSSVKVVGNVFKERPYYVY